MTMADNISEAINKLISIFGKETDTGFGSAVFQTEGNGTESLDAVSLDHNLKFLGKKWAPESEGSWSDNWKECYRRPLNGSGDILTELRQVKEADAKQSIQLLTEFIDPKEDGQRALEGAFNSQDVQQLAVHTIGDVEAYSGAMISALYTSGKI
jgi:hypothetical protein